LNGYLLVPLIACVSSAVLAVAVLARASGGDRTSRAGALLTGGAAVWAFFEVLWNASSDPAVVLWLVKLSSIGWVAVGPVSLHLFLELTGQPARRIARVLPPLYALSALFFVIDVTTPWLHASVLRTSWGWGYTFGPAYPPFYVFTVACLGTAVVVGFREMRRSTTSPGERAQARWLTAGIGVPIVVASATDALLPLAGHQPPRLGTISFSVLGATIAWGFHRYGYSLLAPGLFASEILAILPEGVALLRLDGRIRSANAGLAQLAGVPARELDGRPVETLVEGIRLDPASVLAEQECTLRPDGGPPIPISVSTAVLSDKQGNAIGLVLVARDLREIASLRRGLVTSGRLAAVGQLAAGIAHEINNPITYVRANLGSLRDLLSRLPDKLPAEYAAAIAPALREGEELVDESLDGVGRVAAIVRDVKSFSHAGGGPRQLIELAPLLDGVLRVAAPQLRGAAAIQRCYGDVAPVLGDAQELKQVFLNLVINASQAVSGDEAIRIGTEQIGARAVITVEDQGCGITPDVIAHIFDPFFTTKRVGEGTGLGLSIAYQIVRNHGGELTVDSEPGRGSTFRVELPTAELAEVA